MAIELDADAKLWCEQNDVDPEQFEKVANLLDDDGIDQKYKGLFTYGGIGNDIVHHKSPGDLKTKKKPEEAVYKDSNKGNGILREAAIVDGAPSFVSVCDGVAKRQPLIERNTKILRPPSVEEYPYTPYEFENIDEINSYLQRAAKETPDSLKDQIRIQIKRFNEIDFNTIVLLSANIFGSYFQDRFSTCHYLFVVGDNGTGKSAFGDTFECLAYRAVNITNVTEAFWYRIFGTNEAGQVTIIAEEIDRMEENSHVMAMLKEGYQPHSRVSRMNHDNTRLEFYCPYGIKVMIGEKSPSEWKARGVLDRTFQIKSYKGFPDYNIKDIRNPQGNPRRQRLYNEITDLRKLLFAYRLIHIKDPYKEIDTGLNGRDEELCKPLLQLFYTLGATDKLQKELETTLQHFIDIRNERKESTIEAYLLPAIVDLVSGNGNRIPTTQIWNLVQNTLEGHADEKDTNLIYHSEDFGKLYRNAIIHLICDKFGADKKPQHTRKGNNLVFNIDHLTKMKRVYGHSGEIQTRLATDNETESEKGDVS